MADYGVVAVNSGLAIGCTLMVIGIVGMVVAVGLYSGRFVMLDIVTVAVAIVAAFLGGGAYWLGARAGAGAWL